MLRLLEIKKIARDHGMDLILTGNSQFNRFLKAYDVAYDIVVKALGIEEPDSTLENIQARIQFEILVSEYAQYILAIK